MTFMRKYFSIFYMNKIKAKILNLVLKQNIANPKTNTVLPMRLILFAYQCIQTDHNH